MTRAEKILASHAGREEVAPGELVSVRADLVMANDITAALAISVFEKLGAEKVFDPRKIVFVLDHFLPAKDIRAAEQAKLVREFAGRMGIKVVELGEGGIEHVVLPEEGFAAPGEVVMGGDSHTCTYGALGAFAVGMGSTDIACAMATGEVWMRVPETLRIELRGRPGRWITGKDVILHILGRIGVEGANYMVMEFEGEGVGCLSLDSRFTIANMAVEAGAKTALFPVDEKAERFLRGRVTRSWNFPPPDPDARYAGFLEVDLSELELMVALPPLPSNAVPVGKARGIKLDQVFIGSCTNGRLEDLEIAAGILRGRKVHPKTRCIVIPGSQKVFREALRRGYIEIFIEAGAVVGPPTCGPCLGGHMGVLAEGERCLATTNRNFPGRMGSPKAEIYLSGPAVAAASAVAGEIISPEELIR